MTTAYFEGATRAHSIPFAAYAAPVTNAAPAQSAEAANVLKVVRTLFNRNGTARGNSPESVQIVSVALELARSGESMLHSAEGADEVPYSHMHLRPVFSIKATYKHVGKMRPRRLSMDE